MIMRKPEGLIYGDCCNYHYLPIQNSITLFFSAANRVKSKLSYFNVHYFYLFYLFQKKYLRFATAA